MTTYRNLSLEIKEGIATITIQRESVLNALNEETLEELHLVLEEVLQEFPSIRVVILASAGSKAFIAGADIAEMKDKSPKELLSFASLGQEITKKLENLPQPVIAAVQGYALGGGCELAMACDFIFATPSASFGQPEVLLGITPFFGGTIRLPKHVGLMKAKELIFSGKRVSAEEAKSLGLVLRVIPQESFMKEIQLFASELKKIPPHALAMAKKTITTTTSRPIPEGLTIEKNNASSLFGSSEQQEGMKAFLNRHTNPET